MKLLSLRSPKSNSFSLEFALFFAFILTALCVYFKADAHLSWRGIGMGLALVAFLFAIQRFLPKLSERFSLLQFHRLEILALLLYPAPFPLLIFLFFYFIKAILTGSQEDAVQGGQSRSTLMIDLGVTKSRLPIQNAFFAEFLIVTTAALCLMIRALFPSLSPIVTPLPFFVAMLFLLLMLPFSKIQTDKEDAIA